MGNNQRTTARGVAGFAPTLCRMSAGGDELFWHWVSDTRCQFGGDNLGVAVEEQDGQRPGDVPESPIGSSGRRVNVPQAEAGMMAASGGSGLARGVGDAVPVRRG